jgi:hypothetical protein
MTPHKLKTLWHLLSHLPEALPDDSESTDFPFLEYELDPAIIQRTNGDIPEAVCESLTAIFVADGKILISERGQNICAVVDVLAHYLAEYLGHANLEHWIGRLEKAVHKVYAEYQKLVYVIFVNQFKSLTMVTAADQDLGN